MPITEDQLYSRTKELLEKVYYLAEGEITTAIKHGGLDLSQYDDNYRPARIILQTLLKYAAGQYATSAKDKPRVPEVRKKLAIYQALHGYGGKYGE